MMNPGECLNSPASQMVEFRVSCGGVISAPVTAVLGSSVLAMVWHHHTRNQPGIPVPVDDERRAFESLICHLSGVSVDLTQRDYVDMITLFRCAHKYQNYTFAADVLRQLVQDTSPSTVLHLYSVLFVLPELPPNVDPIAPSAPPAFDLQDSDPEQAEFASLLLHAYQTCLKMIEENCTAVLVSDALFSLGGDSLLLLLRRDSLTADEPQVAAAALRWLRQCAVSFGLDRATRRAVVLGSVRLLQMTASQVKQLSLVSIDVLDNTELAAVLEFIHHGVSALPESLHPYRQYWLTRRSARLTGSTATGLLKPLWIHLQQLASRTRGPSIGPAESLSAVRQRQQMLRKKSDRADRIKMALATGASLIFD